MTLPSATTSRLVCGVPKSRGRSRSRSRSRGRSWSRPRSWSRGRSRGRDRLFELPQSDDDHANVSVHDEEWVSSHVGEIKTQSSASIRSSPSKKKRPPQIDTGAKAEQQVQTKVTVVTKDSPGTLLRHSSKVAGAHTSNATASTAESSTEAPKQTLSSGEDSVDHLVAYYVDQIPSLANLCWHRLETPDTPNGVVHVPARICAVKKASQQAMIDDLGFLKGGRFRVVPTMELIRFSGASTKRKWCSKLMKEYLEYISRHHNANDVKEEERFLKKVLAAVKEKDHTGGSERDARDDDDDESHDSVFLHSHKNGTSIDVHATPEGTSVFMDMRDKPPSTTREDTTASYSINFDESKAKDSSSYYAKKLQGTKEKHAKKHEARVKFDMSDDQQASTPTAANKKAPTLEKPTPIKGVTKQLEEMQVAANSPAVDDSGLDADTWWIVLRGTKLSRGATPLVNRCMRTYGWSEDYTTRVLMGYKQFCAWKQAFEDWDDGALAPPPPIRQMWQQHLLDSRNYQADCMVLFGNILQYNPENGADTMMERERIENTKRIAHVRFRGKDYDREVWKWQDDVTDFSGGKDPGAKIHLQESKRELRPISIPHTRSSSSSDDAVPQSMREALALVQQARRDLKVPKQTRPYSLQIMPNPSSSSDVSSVSSNNVIRLRIIGNGKNGLRSASITMDYAGEFTKVFEEYAGEYAMRIGQPRVFLRFLLKDGRRIVSSDTPKKLRLLNNDEVMVVQQESDSSSWI